MKIYTKTGDQGETSLFSGGRVRKDHLRVEAYGTVDEMNSIIGTARAHEPAPEVDVFLERVQNQLFQLGSDLATPMDAQAEWIVRVDEASVTWLEEQIDSMTAQLEPLKNFVLPGGTLSAGHIHIARTVCRRAERLVVSLAHHEEIGDFVLPYLNRLSDALFTLARYENKLRDINEAKWQVR
jgi:cob(I)alamin adenosyltransferase